VALAAPALRHRLRRQGGDLGAAVAIEDGHEESGAKGGQG
jgi:hypothetical protein